MKTYAMFYDDCEIHVTLKVGTLESLDSLREELIETLKGNPTLERGYGSSTLSIKLNGRLSVLLFLLALMCLLFWR